MVARAGMISGKLVRLNRSPVPSRGRGELGMSPTGSCAPAQPS